jgi:hypothetical protein
MSLWGNDKSDYRVTMKQIHTPVEDEQRLNLTHQYGRQKRNPEAKGLLVNKSVGQ